MTGYHFLQVVEGWVVNVQTKSCLSGTQEKFKEKQTSHCYCGQLTVTFPQLHLHILFFSPLSGSTTLSGLQ